MTDWRQDQVLRTRRAIRQAAVELRAEGLDVSIANIARRAQRHPKTVRRHYSGLSDILLVSCTGCVLVDMIIGRLAEMPETRSPAQMVLDAILGALVMANPAMLTELSVRMREVARLCSVDPDTLGMLVADYSRCAYPRLLVALTATTGNNGPEEQFAALLPSLTGQAMMQIWEMEGYDRPMADVWGYVVTSMGGKPPTQAAASRNRPPWSCGRPLGRREGTLSGVSKAASGRFHEAFGDTICSLGLGHLNIPDVS
jgi:AcrR family transcriptional regulator